MAFLWKHPKSKYYIARFFDRDGKRRNRSTKSTTRKEAQKIADAFEEASRKKRTAKQVRDVISELHKEITGQELVSQSFKAFTDSWIVRKTPEVKPATLAFYKTVVRKFTEFLGERADVQMVELTTEDLVSFRNHEATSLAPKTVNHDLKGLRMIFKDALRDRIISENPAEFVSTTKKAPVKKRIPFTIPQIEAVIAIADDEWKSMIRFGLYTGQRIGDIAALTWQNVDLERKQVRLVQRKTGTQVIIPLGAKMIERLLAMQSSDNPEAPVHPKCFALLSKAGKTNALSNVFIDLLYQAGLREKPTHQKKLGGLGRDGARATGGLGFHCLRVTTTTMGAELGIPRAVIMAITGHEDEAMNAHYTNVGDNALRDAIESLPDI